MKPTRIQLSRKKGWRLPPNTVVVSRPSRWGNPYCVTDVIDAYHGNKIEAQRDCVRSFNQYLHNKNTQDSGATILIIRSALAGKNLACWCKLGTPCHADVLLEIANGGGND